MRAVDLFAGPGGWDLGAQALGIDPLGIEWDDAACATREAAGLRTVQADVAELDPLDYPCDLLIASPPCQAWSMAGKRQGQEDIERVYWLTAEIADADGEPDRLADSEWADERSKLVTEPLRWALALKPRLLAWEQVPPVIDYWKHCAEILREQGYHVWTGILSAERYGVPQTRKRAILLASLDRPVHPPMPTHQEYRAGEPAWDGPMLSLEGELQPWVSMADALGWTAPFGRGGARSYRRTRGTGMIERNGERRDHPTDEPAPTLTAKARSDVWLRANAQENAATRHAEEPAPTIKGGNDTGDRVWTEERPAPTIVGTRRSDQGMIAGRQLPEGEGRNVGGHGWTERRPATNVNGDPRIAAAARRDRDPNYDPSDPLPPSHQASAVRVSIEEASILQSFPPDHPWQGSRSKKFQQIGNAVPPLLARAVLSALLEAQDQEAAA